MLEIDEDKTVQDKYGFLSSPKSYFYSFINHISRGTLNYCKGSCTYDVACTYSDSTGLVLEYTILSQSMKFGSHYVLEEQEKNDTDMRNTIFKLFSTKHQADIISWIDLYLYERPISYYNG